MEPGLPDSSPVNPLVAPWTGPYGGVPPFDRVKVGHFVPGLEAAMAAQVAAIARIEAEAAPPTFENTIAAMERSDRVLRRATTIFEVWRSSVNTPALHAVEREMAPRLAAFRGRVAHDETLFRRIAAVYEGCERAGLTPEQRRLAWLYYTSFVRAGAKLELPAKRRISEIDQRLATLHTTFAHNLLAEEADQVLVLQGGKDLAGLPYWLRSALAADARASGESGRWAVLKTFSSAVAFLTYSDRRDLREKVWQAYVSRCDDGGPRDNNASIDEILALRAERARLLGFESYAHRRLEDAMAKTPERALALLEAVRAPAVSCAGEMLSGMQAIADRERAGIRIAPWDSWYYAEKLCRAECGLYENEAIPPYLQLSRLREAMFWVAEEVFGLYFVQDTRVPVYHPDVVVYRVTDAAGRHVGLWYFDPCSRPGKRSGAWTSAYREPESFDGDVPAIVSNNANLMRTGDEDTLVAWGGARAMFHEFGHSLHFLLSKAVYPSLSAFSMPPDYVEFPSQMLERWLATPVVLTRFARHALRREPMPADLARKVARVAAFHQRFGTVVHLASALVDMRLHLASGRRVDARAVERETLASLGVPPELTMQHRAPQFAHVFSGDGYAAGFYSYLWADVLAADAWEAFAERGGPWDTVVAERLCDCVFAAGNTTDPAEAYRRFRGRDARIDALMRQRRFPVPVASRSD